MNIKMIQQLSAKEILDFLKKVDKRTWIKIGLAALGAVLCFIFIIGPAWFQRVQVRSKIKVIENQIKTLESLNPKKSEWLRNKTEFQKFISGVKERIFKSDETALLLGTVSKLAKESKVTIIASQPQEVKQKFPPPFDAQYQPSLYHFIIEGGYHDLGAFASRIEAFPKVLRIESLSLKPHETNTKSHVASYGLSAVTFKEAAKT